MRHETKPAGCHVDWKYNVLNVNWDVNHRTMTVKLDNEECDVTIFQKVGTDVLTPSDPTKTGYIFVGWEKYGGSSCIPYSFTVMLEENLIETEITNQLVMSYYLKIDISVERFA